MYQEELIEEGIVTECKNGFAIIDILDKDSCDECSAKVYCKSSSSEGRKLTAKDNFGVERGDEVRVSISGRKLISASLFIYGVPLVLLFCGIYLGFVFFEVNRELFSLILGAALIGFYSGIILLIQKYKTNLVNSYPEIIFVKKGNQNETNLNND